MSLIEEILSDYLSKEDLQAIARDHDLPVSRTKDEIIGELLVTDDFEPEEAVAFLSVWQLRTFCQEHGLPSGAYREALVDRVVEALDKESRPSQRPRRTKRAGPESPSTTPGPAPPIVVHAQPAQSSVVEVHVPPPLPPPIKVHVQPAPSTPIHVEVQSPPVPPVQVRFAPPQMAAWGFVGVVATVVFGGIYFATTAVLGTVWGVVTALLSGIVVAVGLLVTERWWAPKLNRLVRPGSPPQSD